MKKLLLVLVGIGLFTPFAKAQIPTINQDVEIFLDNTDFYLNGSYQHEAAAAEFIFNPNRTFYVNRDLTNNATHGMFAPGAGQVRFFDTARQFIRGNQVLFYKMVLTKPDNWLELATNIQLDDTLWLDATGNQGKIELRDRVFDLRDLGVISGETALAYIYGSSTGYVRYEGLLSNFRFFDRRMRGIGLEVEAPAENFGLTTILRYHFGNFPNTGVGGTRIWRYYSFVPSNSASNIKVATEIFPHERDKIADISALKMAVTPGRGGFWEFLDSEFTTDQRFLLGTEIVALESFSQITATDTTACAGIPNIAVADSAVVFLCEGDTLLLDIGIPDIEYRWNTEEFGQQIEVTDSGRYMATAYFPGGCNTSDTVDVILVPRPEAGFLAENTCLGNATIFQDTTTLSLIDPQDTVSMQLTYYWDFGDGNDSTYQAEAGSAPAEMIYHYADTGTYEVKLLVSTPYSCPDSLVQTIRIHANPEANFSLASICVNNNTQFNDLSTSEEGTLTAYFWQFGDGTTDTLQNTQHNYLTTDSLTASLAIETEFGCRDTMERKIGVLPEFVADFSFEDACIGREAQFNYQSSDTSEVAIYEWRLSSDTTVVTTPNRTESYQEPITEETVELVAVSQAGCVDTVRQMFEVIPEPISTLPDSIATCGEQFVLDTENPQEGYTFEWSVGDTTQTLEVVEDGLYNVTINTPGNCPLSDTIFVLLNKELVVDLGQDRQVCELSELDAGPGQTFTWSTGSTERTAIVGESGAYSVQVVDQNGCEDADTVLLDVLAAPKPDLGEDISFCPTAEGAFTLDPQTPEATAYEWSNGDTEATLDVSEAGTYTVLVTNAAGCQNQDTLQMIALPGTDFDFPEDTLLCTDETIFLNPIEDVENTADFSVSWAALNVEFSADSQEAQITESGSYTVEVTSPGGCVVRDTISVSGPPEPVNAFFFVASSINVGDTTLFVNVSTPQEGSSFEWDFGDGASTDQASPTHIYQAQGTYPAMLAMSYEHCKDTLTKTIYVAPRRLAQYEEAEGEEFVSTGPIASMRVYPNPTNQAFTLTYRLTDKKPTQIGIYDLTGRRLATFEQGSSYEGKVDIDLNQLPSGVYIVRLQADRDSQSKRLILQR